MAKRHLPDEILFKQVTPGQYFSVEVTPDGEIVMAELLSTFLIDDKEYALFALENADGRYDILASYIVKDSDGIDELKDIDDPIDKIKVEKFILALVDGHLADQLSERLQKHLLEQRYRQLNELDEIIDLLDKL